MAGVVGGCGRVLDGREEGGGFAGGGVGGDG